MLVNTAVFGILLFLPAGTLHWWRAWVFLAIFFFGSIITMAILLPNHQELIGERLKGPIQEGQPRSDKILILLFLGAFLAWGVFLPLDVFHLHLLRKPGGAVSFSGLLILFLGWWIIFLTFKENAFASAVVRHQEERQHKAIDTGPYSVVRHPMYAGAALFLVGPALWLESCAGALLAIVPVGMLALRIFIEEGLLRQKLAGYEAYTKKVRYRLIPYLW